MHIPFISTPKFNLYRTAVSNWFASQACKPKLPVDRHIQSHFKILIYNISNWLCLKGMKREASITFGKPMATDGGGKKNNTDIIYSSYFNPF